MAQTILTSFIDDPKYFFSIPTNIRAFLFFQGNLLRGIVISIGVSSCWTDIINNFIIFFLLYFNSNKPCWPYMVSIQIFYVKKSILNQYVSLQLDLNLSPVLA